MTIKIQFLDPNAISSTSNTLDKLRIVFVDTSEFLRCEVVDELEKGTRRKLSTLFNSDSIPDNYILIV